MKIFETLHACLQMNYHMENHISIQHFDLSIFESYLPFLIEISYQIGGVGSAYVFLGQKQCLN